MSKTYHQFPELRRMWEAGFSALEECERLIVFGFSFPDSDAAIRQLVRSALMANRSLRQVVILDACADAVAKRLSEFVPGKADLFTSVTVPIDGSVPKWWKCEPVEEAGRQRQPAVVTRVSSATLRYPSNVSRPGGRGIGH
jgi:hypothetical protein